MSALLLAQLLNAAPCPATCDGLQQPPADTVPVSPGTATEPDVHVTTSWLLAQLVPSPGVAFGAAAPHLRLAWQVSPLLYSFGIDRRLSPWRWLVVEPIVRHSGSLEIVVGPDYLHTRGALLERWGYHVMLRSTFGLIERGDYLSLGLGSGYLSVPEGSSPQYELSVYTLFGNLGLTAQYAPGLANSRYGVGLRLRFF